MVAPISTPVHRPTRPAAYAYLSPGNLFNPFLKDPRRVFQTIGEVTHEKRPSDGALANFDDNVKRVGGFSIATLATLGLFNRVMGVGEFLGFASWFFAMTITPKIINSLIRFKTGINLGQEYHSTYGEHLPFWGDPTYLPLHLLPHNEVAYIAHKLKISPDDPNAREKVEQRMRQISIQGRAWWMLVAGPATPVLSGLICDQLQAPVTALWNQAKIQASAVVTRHFYKTNNNPKAMKRFEKSLEWHLKQVAGETVDSEMTRWWQGFGKRTVKSLFCNEYGKLNFNKNDVVKNATTETQDRIIEYLISKRKTPLIERFDAQLAREHQRLEKLYHDALSMIDLVKEKNQTIQEQEAWLKQRYENANATLDHYHRMLEELKKPDAEFSKNTLKILMTKANLSDFLKLQGSPETLKILAGNAERANEVSSKIKAGQFVNAFQTMGAAPLDHLMIVLKDRTLQKLWRQRMLLGVGGVSILLTLIYTQFVLGHPNRTAKLNTNPTQPGGLS